MNKPDQKFFEKIIKDSYNMIYNLGLRLFNYNKEETEDFVQEVFLQVYEKYNSFLEKSKINTWIYSLALNLGLNKIKKNKKFKTLLEKYQVQEIEYEDKEIESIKDLSEELKLKVQKELMQLPDIYRLPLVLYYYEKLTYKEMSEKLNIPEGTLKSLIYRGKLILKNKILNLKEFFE